ncbi:MAG: hypothetical protein CVV52_07890 [Spirochaetae bacterium HGW-Spirochaetae-8]|nr:MAG: hypothetical protein CVV52_07890 [Spirochaetae bacterium HGW-Spirochaetae-8]
MSALLKVVGCRAGSPMKGNPASGYLLQTSKGTILIDCGSGVLANLDDEDFDNLIGVIITHVHADHCLDLMALAYRKVFPSLSKRIPLYGPPSVAGLIASYDALFGIRTLPTMGTPIATAFAFEPVVPGTRFTVADTCSFDTIAMIHPVETIALRSVDFNFVYTADGAFVDSFLDFCQGCRTLLSEATYPDEEGHDLLEHGHMTAPICARLATDSGASNLIVTHLSDPTDSAITMEKIHREFTGTVYLAYPGLAIELEQ